MEGFLRPQATVLDDKSLIPEKNIISPAPNQFTHEVVRSAPYYFTEARSKTKPAGKLLPGTKVVMLVNNGHGWCRVADGQGLYVEVECRSLRKL